MCRSKGGETDLRAQSTAEHTSNKGPDPEPAIRVRAARSRMPATAPIEISITLAACQWRRVRSGPRIAGPARPARTRSDTTRTGQRTASNQGSAEGPLPVRRARSERAQRVSLPHAAVWERPTTFSLSLSLSLSLAQRVWHSVCRSPKPRNRLPVL